MTTEIQHRPVTDIERGVKALGLAVDRLTSIAERDDSAKGRRMAWDALTEIRDVMHGGPESGQPPERRLRLVGGGA
jgi:hypothetical protein